MARLPVCLPHQPLRRHSGPARPATRIPCSRPSPAPASWTGPGIRTRRTRGSGSPGLAGDAGLDDLLAGELAQARGLARGEAGDWAGAIAGLQAAAGHFQAAGQPGQAAAAAARAAWAAAQPDPAADIWPELDAQLSRVTELLAAGQAGPADVLTVRHARGAAAALAVQRAVAAAPGAAGGDPGSPVTMTLDAEARALLADARAHGSLAREAAAMALLAFAASVAGAPGEEEASLARMCELLDQAGQPWATAAALTRRGELALREGQLAQAGALLEQAVAVTGQWPPRSGAAPAAGVLLAHVRAGQGAALVSAGRGPEAIALLTEAIAGLGETEVAARARADLGQAFRQAGDPQSAARQFTLATAGLSAGPDQEAHLAASLETARALAEAAMWAQARQAYEYARLLGTGLGQWPPVVRIHRELAHLHVQEQGDAGLPAAMAQLDQARMIAEASGAGEAARGAAGAAGAHAALIREHGLTCYEAAQVLVHAGHLDQALGWLDRAIADLSAEDRDIETVADVTYFAADIEGNRLGRAEAARQRLAPVIARCGALHAEQSRAALSQLSAQLQGSAATSGAG